MLKPPQQKTPRREGGALLGLLQGGEICISIYVDRWEVGEPCLCRGRRCGKQRGHVYGAGPDLEVLVLAASAPPLESLNSVRTYVRFVCEADHREAERSLHSLTRLAYPPEALLNGLS